MRRVIVSAPALALALALSLAACQPSGSAPETEAAPKAAATAAKATPLAGNPAPTFTLADADGVQRSLADFRGKTVVLEWTNEACPYVRKHYTGAMQALQRQAAEDGVVWISLISSAPGQQGHVEGAAARGWKARTGAASAHLLLDPTGRVGKAYGAKTTPDMRIIDGEGRLVFVGAIDDRRTTDPADLQGAANFVRAALEDVQSGRPVRTAFAEPYGCSVKYGEG